MKRFIYIFLATLLIPMSSQAEDVSEQFQSAIRAVENRDYASLVKLLEDHPGLLSYVKKYRSGDCSLFCEFSRLLRSPLENEASPEVDVIALEILLDSGGDPAISPHALGELLISANIFHGDVSEFPINSGNCTKSRNKIFPIVNKMISYGSPLDILQRNFGIADFSMGFLYVFQLCQSVYSCGAEYESTPSDIALEVSKSITSAERDLLLELASGISLSRKCVSSVISSHQEL